MTCLRRNNLVAWIAIFLLVGSLTSSSSSSAEEKNENTVDNNDIRKKKKNHHRQSNDLFNIVILFADNLGYGDVSTFAAAATSGETKTTASSKTTTPPTTTPNIDKLASQGIKFLNWNSAAHLCSASRATLLTGKYPVRTGVYPRVFRNDAKYGLLSEEITLAEVLKVEGYATSIVGKWHLGHRPDYLPTNQGFDEWLGIPYHMSGGSVDNHTCNSDTSINQTMWLPLYENEQIIQQPVQLETLAHTYATKSRQFIERNAKNKTPFFLYMAFSHVHQLCAPKNMPEQATCQWANTPQQAVFADAVQEMDSIAGEILDSLDKNGVANNTLVIFTSDNGPWVAEQSCAGLKGPFQGQWFKDNADPSCTACPHDYVPEPTDEDPRRCVLPGTDLFLTGVSCGEDTGLGSVWEANLRMPAIARFPGKIASGSETMAMVSTLDVMPTILSMLGRPIPANLDGMDVSDVYFGKGTAETEQRILFFWRDGFEDGPLPPPYGRFDVVAVKLGRIKAWFSTKSAHYNDDVEVYHDPPLLFDTLSDPAESLPLDPSGYHDFIQTVTELVRKHKESIDWTLPLALASDPKYLPCVDPSKGCRTEFKYSSDAYEGSLILDRDEVIDALVG